MRRFLDYYRQFEALSPEEDSQRLREKREAERSQELARVPPLDLSRSEWHEPPDPELVNAATFALRRSINRYPPGDGEVPRRVIAHHLDLPSEQVALGHGAGQLLQATLRSMALGGEAVMAWPSWEALPALAARAGVRPVPVAPTIEAMTEAVSADTRAVILCSPNDPTGALVSPEEIRSLAQALRDDITVIVDEALVEFAGEDASIVPLVEEIPNLLVFRSFSKAWALAGLRVGYVVGSSAAVPLLSELGPGQGVSSPAQSAVTAAFENRGRSLARLERRRRAVADEQRRLSRIIEDLPFTFEASHAHVIWMRGDGFTAASLAHGLEQQHIAVASGAAWGDEEHVRITLRDKPATERLGSALRALV